VPGPAAEAPNEFSRIVAPDRLGGSKRVESLEATPAERAAVARRLDILAVDRLVAELAVKALGGALYRVEGSWEAAVSQACVVTLEPVEAGLSGRIEATYEAADSVAAENGEVTVDPEAADPAEILPSGGIDLGELVVQELAVALDPYPRAPGAEVPAEYRPPEAEEEAGPFAALKALKGDR
jgi:uncharacterized metal-binding protein YceD (DUF177 family)